MNTDKFREITAKIFTHFWAELIISSYINDHLPDARKEVIKQNKFSHYRFPIRYHANHPPTL